jgi:hypothetical protein
VAPGAIHSKLYPIVAAAPTLDKVVESYYTGIKAGPTKATRTFVVVVHPPQPLKNTLRS